MEDIVIVKSGSRHDLVEAALERFPNPSSEVGTRHRSITPRGFFRDASDCRAKRGRKPWPSHAVSGKREGYLHLRHVKGL